MNEKRLGGLLVWIGIPLIIGSNFWVWQLSYYYVNMCTADNCAPFLQENFSDIVISTVLFAIGCVMLFRGVWMLQSHPKKTLLAAEIMPLLLAFCFFNAALIVGNIAGSKDTLMGPLPEMYPLLFYSNMLWTFAQISFAIGIAVDLALIAKYFKELYS